MQPISAERQAKHSHSPAVSRAYPDGTLVELLYRPADRATAFAVGKGGTYSIKQEIEIGGERLTPFSPRNNLIRNAVVLLPSEPGDYGSEEELKREIGDFIHRYVDFSLAFEKVATHYVLLSWVYDAFNELPYLRCGSSEQA